MKKAFRFTLIAIAGLIMSLSLAIGLSFAFPAKENTAAAASVPTGRTFEMAGMSIRYEGASGEDGVRIRVKLDITTYNELLASSTAALGVLVTPKDMTPGYLDMWIREKTSAQRVVLFSATSNKNYLYQEGNYYYGCVYLHGFPEASYNRPIMTRAYIDWNNDGNSATVWHSNHLTKSIADVATAVMDDYDNKNEFATTEEQYNKLDVYRPNYNISFTDAYGNTTTQENLKYGTKFYQPSTPSREGYTFNGWARQTGTDTYDTPATIIADKTVMYNATYKAMFTMSGDSYDKPVLEKGLSDVNRYYGDKDYAYVYYDGTQIFASDSKANAFFFKDITVPQNTNFAIYATITADANNPHANQIGFVVGTLASETNHLMMQFHNNRLYFARYNGTATDTNSSFKAGAGYGSRNNAVQIGLVYIDGTYYMLLDGVVVAKIGETEQITNAWSGGKFTIQDYVGTSGDKHIGLSCFAGRLYCSDWSFTTADKMINFIDQYGNTTTQMVRSGQQFTQPSNPSSMEGYAFEGWALKTGADSYASAQTTISNKTATDNATYVATFTPSGATQSRPAVTDSVIESNWLYGSPVRTYSNNYSTLALKGMYMFSNAEVSQGTDYMLSATFTRAETSEVGFIITTKNVSEWAGAVKNLAFVYRSAGDMYLWGTSIWRQIDSVTVPAVGEEMKLTIVYKSPMFYVFVGDTIACSIDERTTAGDASPKNAIGTSGAIKFGLASQGATTTFTDWSYSTNATVISNALANVDHPLLETKINNAAKVVNIKENSLTLTTDGNAVMTSFFSGVELAQNQDFVMYADVEANFTASAIGFVLASDTSVNNKHVLIHWRSNLIAFWRTAGGWAGYDGTNYPGYGDKTTSKHIALVYRAGRYYLYMNGTQVFNKKGTDDVGWSNTINGLVGTDGTKKIGLSVSNGSMTCSDWGYSTDPNEIAYHAAYNYAKLTKLGNTTSRNLDGANGTDTWGNIYSGSGEVVTAYYNGIEVPQNQDFVIYTKVQSGFPSQIGFVVGTNPTGSGAGSHMLFHFLKDEIRIWRNAGWAGHADGIIKPGYSSNGSAVSIALLYKGGRYYMFLNGAIKWSGSENGFDNGWGGNVVLKTQIGTEGTKKIGLSLYGSGMMDINTWGCSTNADYIAANYPTT